MRMSASTYLYRSVSRDASGLKLRIQEITETRVHYGYRRVHVILHREGYRDNVKRVYRLYEVTPAQQGRKLRQPKKLTPEFALHFSLHRRTPRAGRFCFRAVPNWGPGRPR
jgi:transposase InsO family protein